MRIYTLFATIALGAALALSAACGTSNTNPDNGEVSGNGGVASPGPTSLLTTTIAIAAPPAAVGETTVAELTSAAVESPGLGAWEIDIEYDPAIVTPVECAADLGEAQSACNPDYADTIVRVVGATAVGLTGPQVLVQLTFECVAAGTSPLTPIVNLLADGTIGGPQTIVPPVTAGEVVCG